MVPVPETVQDELALIVTGRPLIEPPGGAPAASSVTAVPAAKPLANVETCPGALTVDGVVLIEALVQVVA
jgi:hypothetical protein